MRQVTGKCATLITGTETGGAFSANEGLLSPLAKVSVPESVAEEVRQLKRSAAVEDGVARRSAIHRQRSTALHGLVLDTVPALTTAEP